MVWATGLEVAGIGRERRLAMLMLDTVDFPVVFLGAIRGGIVPVPLNTLLLPEQYAYLSSVYVRPPARRRRSAPVDAWKASPRARR